VLKNLEGKEVSDNMEKRASKRHHCEASMTCGYFNRTETSDARIFNYSQGGAYLECPSFFKEKSTVLLRLNQVFSRSSDPETYCTPRAVSLGEVRWCKNIGDEDASYFAMGIQYY
jgi:hypothetical protein